MARTRVRWGRVGALVASAGLAVSLAAGAAHAGGPAGRAGLSSRDPRASVPVRTYVVRAGDTLWAIAARMAGPHGDPRPVVDALAHANRLGGVLVPGKRLVLPG